MPKRIAHRILNRLGKQSIEQHYLLSLILGALVALLGLLAFTTPTVTARISLGFVGIVLVMAGGLQAISHLFSGHFNRPDRPILRALGNVTAGAILLLRPTASIVTISLILATVYIVGGVYTVIAATLRRGAHWKLLASLGVVIALFGILIYARWPGISLNILGRFVGMNLMIEGGTWLYLMKKQI